MEDQKHQMTMSGSVSYLQLLHHFHSGISSCIAPRNFSVEFLLPPFGSYPQPHPIQNPSVETGFLYFADDSIPRAETHHLHPPHGELTDPSFSIYPSTHPPAMNGLNDIYTWAR